jgi:hypothetical protein
MNKTSTCILGGIAAGIIWLAFIGLERGAPDLTALATVLVAGAALISSITKRGK